MKFSSPDDLFDHVAKVLGDRVAETLSDQLAGILDRELDLQVLVPVGVDLEFALPDPFGVVLDDAGDFEVVGNVEFFQSGPDCERVRALTPC
jgi:hypothetical protein